MGDELFAQRCGLMLNDRVTFKSIDDVFGRQAEDDVLRFAGRILRDELRESGDGAVRLGKTRVG